MNDWELLQAYLHQQSESAFAALMERYLRLVYSAAFRQVNNSALAQEVTQATFIILARKAPSFRRETVLAGWLFRTTRHVALTAIRSEQRRHRREQAAFETGPPNSEPELWKEIAPMLDEALAQLGETDRNAVLLRFFQQKSLADVGLAIGTTEDAAKKRVGRAVEKLRRFFARRGVGMTGTGLGACLWSASVSSTPAGLAARVASSVLLGQGSLGVSSVVLVEEALRQAALAKARALGVWAAAVIVATLLVTITWQKWASPASDPPASPSVVATGNANPAASQAQPFTSGTDPVPLPAALPLRVLAAEDGRVLARAAVRVKYFGREAANLELFTDREGLCRIPLTLRPFRQLNAIVEVAGYVPRLVTWFRYEMESNADLQEYTLRLEPGCYLSGLVLDLDGQPVPRARLTAAAPVGEMAEREENASCSSESDPQGQWILDQLPAGVGQVRLTVEHPDFAILETNLVFKQAAQPQPVLQLSPGVSVSGLVALENGAPVPGATVTADDTRGFPSQNLSTVTSHDGWFYFGHANPGKMRLLARAAGYGEAAREIELDSDMEGVLITLTAAASATAEDPNAPGAPGDLDKTIHLRGTVLDADSGQPIDRFKVLFGRRYVWSDLRPVPSVHTLHGAPRFLGEGHAGAFDWHWPPQEGLREFQLEIRAVGYAPVLSDVTAAVDGLAPFDFRLSREAWIVGKVLSPDGAPAGGARICLAGKDSMPSIVPTRDEPLGFRIYGNAEPGDQAAADSEGRFSVRPVAGTDRLVVLHESGCRMVQLADLRAERIVLQGWGRVEGELRVGTVPGTNQSVCLEIADHSSRALRVPFSNASCRTDQSGRFSFQRVPPGRYRLFRVIRTRTDGTGPFALSHPVEVQVKAGRFHDVLLGGTGRKVIGRVRTDPETAVIDWGRDLQVLTTRRPELALPPGEDDADADLSRAQQDRLANYFFTVNPDGSFVVDDIPPGQFELNIRLTVPMTPPPALDSDPNPDLRRDLGSVRMSVVIPDTADQPQEPVDLGVVTVNLQAR